MYKINKEFSIEFAHRLNLPYESRCVGIHGHTGRIIISISAEKLNENDMIIDFSEIKNHIQTYFEDLLDHTLILNRTDEFVNLLVDETKLFLLDGEPTAENLSKLIHDKIVKILNKINLTVSKVSVTFFETAKNSANYSSDINSIEDDRAEIKISMKTAQKLVSAFNLI